MPMLLSPWNRGTSVSLNVGSSVSYIQMPCRPGLCATRYLVSPTGTSYVDGDCFAVAQYEPTPPTPYVSGSQTSGTKAKVARLARPVALPVASLQPSRSARSTSALAEVPTRAKSFWQALITQAVVALGLSWLSQKSTCTWCPSRPPAALTSLAHALTTLTESLNRPGTSGVFTSAIMPTLMVVAVIPMSEAGTVPVGAAEADCEAAADVAADADVEAGVEEAGAAVLLVLEEHPAATRTAAAMAAVSPAMRVLLRVLRPVPPRPGTSLLTVTLVPSTTSLPARIDPATPVRAQPKRAIYRAVSKERETDCAAEGSAPGNLLCLGRMQAPTARPVRCKPLHNDDRGM